ncbi:MAG: Gfo/Idh/MocA family oxidoreductase [Spirochaetales bacterium]|nr:Gfo/Idh/MocA family oxidoreductase [Spirochaetales bacterium]
MRKVRSAVIGLGFIGIAHIEAIRRLGYVDVVALCTTSRSREKAEKLFVDSYYSDYKEMLNREELDFVHICTPNASHYPIASYALEKGVNVILEKPMTLTVEEGEKLAGTAEERGLVAAVNFHNRFYPATHHLREKIRKDDLGRIISVSGCYVQDWLLYRTDYSWRLLSDISGATRAVADIGSHWVDLAEYTTGLKVSEVMADFQTVYEKRKKPLGESQSFSRKKSETYEEISINTEDIASILFRFDNGATGCCFISQMFAGKKNRIQLMVGGTESSAEWNMENQEELILGFRDRGNEVLTKDARLMAGETEALIGYPAGHPEGFPDAFKQCFNQVYQRFLDPDSPVCYADFTDGLRGMRICEAIHNSAVEHRFVKVEDL